MSTHPIKLKTTYGHEQFKILFDQRKNYENIGLIEEFKNRCRTDYSIQEKCLTFFLDDNNLSRQYPMNDEDKLGFSIFNEQSDVCSCLNYFSGDMYGTK